MPPASIQGAEPAPLVATRRVVLAAPDAAEANWLQMRVGQSIKVVHCALELEALMAAFTEPVQAAVVMFDARHDLTKSVQLAQWLRKYKHDVAVLALGYATTVQVPMAALRAGVQDFLDIGAESEDMLEPLWAACARGGTGPVTMVRGQTVALLGGRAGMGVTTLAVHLSAALASLTDAHNNTPSAGYERTSEDLGIGLLDLGFPLRDAQMLLGVHGGLHMVEAIQGMHRLDKPMLESALPRHSNGTAVLSWPAQTQALRDVSPISVSSLVQRLRSFYAWQVIDLGAFPSAEILQEVIREADHVWMVCDQSVGGIVSLSEMMKGLHAPSGQPLCEGLIVNRWHKDAGLPAADIAQRLELPLLHTLPNREAALLESSSAGMLLSETEPTDPYVLGVRTLATELLEKASGGQRNKLAKPKNNEGGWRSLLSKIRRSA